MHCICFQNLTKKAKKKRYNFIANRLRISILHLLFIFSALVKRELYRLKDKSLTISNIHMLHRKVIETKIGNALRSLSFYHLLRLFFESIPLEKARSCCFPATIWVKSIVLWIRERPYSTPILLDQCQMEAMEYHHHCHY